MAVVMIGVDPHKASHTAVAIDAAEEQLGQLRVRACADQRFATDCDPIPSLVPLRAMLNRKSELDWARGSTPAER